MTTLFGAAEECSDNDGSIDKTTAPTSQNQLATSAPHQSRWSARRC